MHPLLENILLKKRLNELEQDYKEVILELHEKRVLLGEHRRELGYYKGAREVQKIQDAEEYRYTKETAQEARILEELKVIKLPDLRKPPHPEVAK